jgi:hypothetical protein
MNRLAVTPFLFCSLLALAVTACGDDGGGGETPDAMQEPERPDAMDPMPMPDAMPDVPPDAAPPPTPEIVVSATTLSVNEGSTEGAQITVKLSASPGGALAVAIANPGGVTVAPAALNFTADDFGTEQTVTVTAPNDVNDNNETLTLTFSADGLVDVTVEVTVIDDDSLNILADPTTVTVDEEDTATFDVSLTVQPDANVTVNVASGNEGKATVDAATLTFTPANYDQPQTVTVSGLADADVADDPVTVTLSSDGLTDVTVSVTVADDDTQTIQVNDATIDVNEGGDGSFTVRLSNDPLGEVEVTVASSNGAAATASPATLTFDSSNYDDPQTVTVSGTSDDNVADATATVTLSAADVADATVTVNVNDDDTQTIVASATSVSVNETAPGNTGTFTVRLSHDPLGSFTVTLTSTDADAATVSPTSLTFDSSNYDTPQTVTASGVVDMDRNAESVPVRLSGTAVADVNVTVNVADTTPPFAVDMFVRIRATTPNPARDVLLTYLGNDRYRATVALNGPDVINFKIGDANNTLATTFAVVNPTNPVMTLGTPKTLTRTNNINNQLLIIQNATGTFNYVFDFDASNTTNPVLTVTLP